MTSDNLNTQSYSKIIGFFLTTLITFLFLFYAFKNVDFGSALKIISNSSLWYILIYIFVFFLSHYLRALRWRIMLKPVKKDLSDLNLFGSVIVGYGVSCAIPRLGELYRALFLGKWEGISRTTVIGTIILERIIDIIGFAIAAVLSILIFSGNLLDEIIWLKTSLLIGFILILVMILMLVLLTKFERRFIKLFLKLLEKINVKLALKVESIIVTLVDGLNCIQGVKNFILIAFISALIIIAYAVNSYVGFYIIDIPYNHEITFSLAWIVMTISAFGSLIPTPGGVGTYHAISIFVLTQIYNFNYDLSAAYALITHFITYIGFVLSTITVIFAINKIRERNGLPKETFLSVFKSRKGDS